MAARSTSDPVPGDSTTVRGAADGRTVDRAAGDDQDLPAITGHQPALDGLRVVAALAVLITHIGSNTGLSLNGSPLSWVVDRGDVGVPIFFVLSGLLLYRPWARAVLQGRQAPATGTYLWRRALRILPAYWTVVAIALVTLNKPHASSPVAWIQYLGLIQIYDPHPWWQGTGANGLAQMWSLAVEVSFYAVLPVLAAVLARYARGGAGVDARARRLLIGIAILAASSYAYLLAGYPDTLTWLGDTLPRAATWFAPGMALAVVSVWAHADSPAADTVRRFCRTVAFSGGTCWLIATLTFALACTPLAGPEAVAISSLWQVAIDTGLYTIIATALVAPAAFQPPRTTHLSAVLGNPLMSFLGKISYSVFLWQFLVISALSSLFRVRTVFQGGSFSVPGNIVAFVAVIVATIATSIVSYYLIEVPAARLRLRRGRAERRRPDGQPAGRHARPEVPPAPGRQRPSYAGPQPYRADRWSNAAGPRADTADPGGRYAARSRGYPLGQPSYAAGPRSTPVGPQSPYVGLDDLPGRQAANPARSDRLSRKEAAVRRAADPTVRDHLSGPGR